MLFKILDESNRKLKKVWVNKGSEFYNRSMKSWLQNDDIKMYSKHNEGKSVVDERFIGTLKNKIYKYMTSKPKNVYIDKLEDIANKYNHAYHSTKKINPLDIKSNTYINFNKENKKENPKFEVNDCKRILKYKKIFSKGYAPNWSEEV